MKNINNEKNVSNPFRMPMKKKSHFNKRTRSSKLIRPFKDRRQAIKRGEYSAKSLFGFFGCSSFYH